MLNQLRTKFIALNMATVGLVLAAFFAAACLADCHNSMAAVNDTLNAATLQIEEEIGDAPLAHIEKLMQGAIPQNSAAPQGAAPATPSADQARGPQQAPFADADDEADAAIEAQEDERDAQAEAAEREAEAESEIADADADAAEAGEDAAEPDGEITLPGADEGDAAEDADEAPETDEPATGFEPADIDDLFEPIRPPEIGGNPGGRSFLPTAAYLVMGAKAFSLTENNTAALSTGTLTAATADLKGEPDGFHTLSDLGLFCKKTTLGSDSSVLVFTDMSAASGWKDLAWQLALVWLAVMGIFFVVNLFFSRWALKPVEAAWAQQSRFAADASHELKTPLTVILANNSILMDNPDATVGSQRQWLESTQVEARRMQDLVNDLLFLARPHADAAARQRTWSAVDFSELAEGDLLQFESVAYERGISIESAIEPGLEIEGDAARLHRLTSTLIDNACKYAESGTVVSVSMQRAEHGKLKMSVHNDGAAVAPEDLERIFDRFYRTDKARARTTGGHGLGLAIAREVAEEHGGTIEASSAEGTGTTFTVTLPLARS